MYGFFISQKDMAYWDYIFPPARLGEYFGGFFLGCIVRLLMGGGQKHKNGCCDRAAILDKIFFTFLELFGLVFWIIQMYTPTDTLNFWIAHWLLPNYLLIGIFMFGKGYVSKLFSMQLFKKLGNISYECFLIHQPIIIIYSMTSGVYAISNKGNIFSLLYCLILTVLIAIFIKQNFKFIEIFKNTTDSFEQKIR